MSDSRRLAASASTKLIAAMLAFTLFVMMGPAFSADARGAGNVQLVKTFLKDIRMAVASGDPAKVRAVAERYMSGDYIQHAPGWPPGREGYIQVMSKMLAGPRPVAADSPQVSEPAPSGASPAAAAFASGPPPGPIGKPKDLYFFGDGDYVIWVSESPFQDPSRAGNPKLTFNMLRIEDGKLKEHWDSNEPGSQQAPAIPGGGLTAGGPEHPPGGSEQDGPLPGPPAGGVGMRLSDDPKLLSPLPPAPPGAEPPPADPHNLDGIWLAETMLGGPPRPGAPPPHYTPKAAKDQQHRMELMAQGKPIGGVAARCRPMQQIQVGADLFPAQIIQGPDKIVIFNEEGRTRWQIFMNRGHPRDLQSSFWGDSVGHWEGDTLVVDTVGFNGQYELRSPKAHIVSRIRKLGDGRRLELKVTTEDPENYTRPFEQTAFSVWHPELQLLEFQCEENPDGAREGLEVQ